MSDIVPTSPGASDDLVRAELRSRLAHRAYEPPVFSRPPACAPSLEMLCLGFVLGVLVAILLGAISVAPMLGIAAAVVFAATDL